VGAVNRNRRAVLSDRERFASVGRGHERGDVAPMVILASLTMFLVLFVLQVALAFHARSVVIAAAQDGLRAAQLEGSQPEQATQAAAAVLAGSRQLVREPVITIEADGRSSLRVSVHGEVVRLVPFWDGAVHAQVSGPVERFRPEGDRS